MNPEIKFVPYSEYLEIVQEVMKEMKLRGETGVDLGVIPPAITLADHLGVLVTYKPYP